MARLRSDARAAFKLQSQTAIKMEALKLRENIVGTIRAMSIGEEIEFPIDKASYIRCVVPYRDLLKERQAGCRWSTNIDNDKGVIIVTRTA